VQSRHTHKSVALFSSQCPMTLFIDLRLVVLSGTTAIYDPCQLAERDYSPSFELSGISRCLFGPTYAANLTRFSVITAATLAPSLNTASRFRRFRPASGLTIRQTTH